MFDLHTHDITELLSVNERFRQQLVTLPMERVDERVAKAAEWFVDAITVIVKAVQPLVQVDITNKEV